MLGGSRKVSNVAVSIDGEKRETKIIRREIIKHFIELT